MSKVPYKKSGPLVVCHGIVYFKIDHPKYKYQLAEEYTTSTPVDYGKNITTDFLHLTEKGFLTVKQGYAWDGASGPTIDCRSSMRGSLVHDAFFQLMRMSLLPQAWLNAVNKLFYEMLLDDGMWRFRAWLYYHGVRKFAWWAAKPRG